VSRYSDEGRELANELLIGAPFAPMNAPAGPSGQWSPRFDRTTGSRDDFSPETGIDFKSSDVQNYELGFKSNLTEDTVQRQSRSRHRRSL
jgi:hypothetical protein